MYSLYSRLEASPWRSAVLGAPLPIGTLTSLLPGRLVSPDGCGAVLPTPHVECAEARRHEAAASYLGEAQG